MPCNGVRISWEMLAAIAAGKGRNMEGVGLGDWTYRGDPNSVVGVGGT